MGEHATAIGEVTCPSPDCHPRRAGLRNAVHQETTCVFIADCNNLGNGLHEPMHSRVNQLWSMVSGGKLGRTEEDAEVGRTARSLWQQRVEFAAPVILATCEG